MSYSVKDYLNKYRYLILILTTKYIIISRVFKLKWSFYIEHNELI